MPQAPTVGRLLPGCVVVQSLSWGAKVRSGDYLGTVRGASAAVGDRILVMVDEVEGNRFSGRRMR